MIAFKEAVTILVIGIAFSPFASVTRLDTPFPPNPPTSSTTLYSAASQNIKALPCTTTDSKTGNTTINTWKNFNIQPDPAYDKREYQLINDALYKLMKAVPCINFGIWPANSTPTGDYVRIMKTIGCSSAVGRQGGEQIMNLQSPGCMNLGSILHEMIHALGLYHEHVRPDRNNYVKILMDNVKPEKRHNFEKRSTNTFNVSYNYQSIMHYNSKDFSENGLPTIVALNGAPVGSVGKLQDTDIKKLKLLYKCS